MKRLLLVLLTTLSLFACAAEQPDLADMLERGLLIDTRTLAEYNAGTIPGSILVPHDSIALHIGRLAESKATPIIVYCRSGRRSGIAAKTLRDIGYTNVVDLGGIQDAYRAVSAVR